MSSTIVVVRVVLALACVLGLIWFAGRKLSGPAGVRRTRTMPLTVIGRQSLGKGSGVALIEVAGRVLLLGVGEQGVRVLTEIDVPAEPLVLALADIPGLAPDSPHDELREELDLAALTDLNPNDTDADDDAQADAGARRGPQSIGAAQLANLAGLAGLAATSSAREVGALHGSILSPDTWRRAVDVVQRRTVRR